MTIIIPAFIYSVHSWSMLNYTSQPANSSILQNPLQNQTTVKFSTTSDTQSRMNLLLLLYMTQKNYCV